VFLVFEYCVDTVFYSRSVFLVFEYCDHDLGHVLDSMPQHFTLPQVKCLVHQVGDKLIV
jgi:hypothetical protein